MALDIRPDLASTSARGALPGIGAALARAWLWVRTWVAWRRERHTLAELDDRLLRDVGVIRDRDLGLRREGAHESDRWFWPP